MYVITGATGNTGKHIAEHLLATNQKVTVISRSAENVKSLTEKGAIAAVGSVEDADFLTKTFTGATAVYAMIPPNFAVVDFSGYQAIVTQALVTAIKNSGVKNVVTLSSVGAHSDQTGVVAGLYKLEQALNAIPDLNVLHLRAGFFMQNFFGNIGLIKNMNINGGFPINGDLKMPMVHTNDIGATAVKRLLALDFQGKSHTYVAGTRDVSLAEVTQVLGAAIGKPDLAWVTFSYEQAAQGMVQMGMQKGLVDGYVQFGKASNEGILLADYQRKIEYTTPTSIEDFAKEFAFVYQNG
jgi:uncharacterized protein YbjT (DUF2867 family)